jgi:hypothetical protein
MSENDSRRDPKDASVEAPEEASAVRTGRRSFLQYAGFTFAAVAIPDWLSGCAAPVSSGSSGEAFGTTKAAFDPINVTVPDTWVTAVRRDDLLSLRFNFIQMQAAGGQLSLIDKTKPGLILVEFPPQHIVEPTFDEPMPGSPPVGGTRPIDARIAQKSRVAFYVPPMQAPIKYDLQDLLQACTQFALNVAPNAVGAADDTLTIQTFPTSTCGSGGSTCSSDQAVAAIGGMNRARGLNDLLSDTINADTPPATTPPAPAAKVADSETSIELPYRLVLSPSQALRFAHAGAPVQSMTSTLTELWTSRLARADAAGNADETTRVACSVRAVASLDLASPLDPFSTGIPDQNALHSGDRLNLIDQSSNFTTTPGRPAGKTYPIHAKSLLLSSRGGTLDVLGSFEEPKDGLLSWQHRASIGRDNYVRVEYDGILFPWGHRASLVTISERKFLANPNNGAGPRTAFLWKRQFVLIRQPFKDYSGLPPNGPFLAVKILTPSTPPIDPVPVPLNWFWPTVNNGTAVRLSAQLVDLEKNILTANIATIFVPSTLFVPGTLTVDTTLLKTLQNEFQTKQDPDTSFRCASDFQGQRVAYALTTPATLGKTTHETRQIKFGAFVRDQGMMPPPPPRINATNGGDQQPSDYTPDIQTTEIAVASVRQFTGAGGTVTMEYAKPYVTGDTRFGPGNPGEVFLSLVAGNDPLPVDFGAQSQRAGAFLTPSMTILGMSRQIGPLPGLIPGGDLQGQITKLATGNADPTQVFGGMLGQTKLFGCFTLSDLFGGNLPFPSMPSFVTHTLDVIATTVKTLNQAQLALEEVKQAASSPPPELQTALNQLSVFEDKVSKFVTAVGDLKPTDPTGFVTAVKMTLDDVRMALGTLQSDISAARSKNAQLPLNPGIPDSLFAVADSLIRQASGMLPPSGLPQEIIDALNAVANAANVATHMSSRFEWSTSPGDVQPITALGIPQIFFPSDGSSFPKTVLKITGEVRAHEVAGKPAGLDITATLNNFDINLVGVGTVPTPYNSTPGTPKSSPLAFLALSFDHLTFTAMAGQKPSIDVGFKDLTFQGPVHFLNALKNIIPLNGFSDPPGISVDSQGIHGDFSIALPSLGVGVFSLENINLGAGFHIPFIGQPMTVGFHFSERQNPFHLTVSLLGGGGYFLMDLSLQGVQLIEAALEFGAEAAIDLVVASGSVLIMAGIYFRYDASSKPDPGVTLTGYVRIAGSMSVIGLITASVEMRLDLGYQHTNGQDTAFGEATISIEVSIMFFSASVDVHAEKTFGGNNGDPTFVEVMGTSGGPGTDWDTYCNAFAA